MQFQKKEKRQTTVRFDSHHVRLRTGEVQRKTGSYMYRWTDKLGKRNTIYAATLEDLREQEEQILVDQHDGIKANIKNVTVNDVYELWCQLKRGIKDSTMKNYIYMYELFVKPTFGKKKLVQVKKSDVRRFYNQLIDDKVLKPSTVDVIHNIVHQVFQIAVDDDMIRSNPAANMLREIKMAHGSEIEKRKALTLEQEELFLGYLARTSKYQHWYPIFYIMANTGMRVGEITGLRWCDVDMENGIISVNHTLVYYNHRDEKGCYFSINTPKTKAGSKSLYRGLGSIDIAAIARSVLMISRDESRPDIRYMYPIKSSLAPEGPAIAFSFKEHGGIVWHGKYDLNTAELMDSITVKTTKRERARAKLVQLLEHEDRPAKEVYAGLADIGVGSRTVEKAKKELQVTTYRSGGSWYWSLPKPK